MVQCDDFYEKGDLIFGDKISRDENGKVDEILDIGDVAIFIVNDPKLSEYQYINTHRIVGYYYEYTEDGITVWVTKAEGEKCERCWKYRKLGEVAGHETVCKNCAEAVG